MNRTEKAASVESLRQKFSKAQATFLTEYRGMSVDKLYELRKKVRANDGELKVVKNRIAKIAVKGSPYESLVNELKGPLALAFAYKDSVNVAKAVSESISETSPFKIRSGNLLGKSIDAKSVVALSKLPSKEVLLSTLLSALQGPIQNLANVLSAMPRDLVNVMTALKDKKETK